MSRQDRAHKEKWEAKKREAGYVRGPRITAEAAERLRTLAFECRMTPSEVVSRLLIEAGERDGRVHTAMREHGLSLAEARCVVAQNLDVPRGTAQ